MARGIKVTPSSGNVFRDLGFSAAEAARLLMRADLLIQIEQIASLATRDARSSRPRLTCFWKHGFRRVNMKDIAEAAGISRPGLYLYFRTKNDVFKAAIT